MIIGTTINSRYDIKMLIGDGGMANVYLAYDRTLKRHVAIKMLRYELSNCLLYTSPSPRDRG